MSSLAPVRATCIITAGRQGAMNLKEGANIADLPLLYRSHQSRVDRLAKKGWQLRVRLAPPL